MVIKRHQSRREDTSLLSSSETDDDDKRTFFSVKDLSFLGQLFLEILSKKKNQLNRSQKREYKRAKLTAAKKETEPGILTRGTLYSKGCTTKTKQKRKLKKKVSTTTVVRLRFSFRFWFPFQDVFHRKIKGRFEFWSTFLPAASFSFLYLSFPKEEESRGVLLQDHDKKNFSQVKKRRRNQVSPQDIIILNIY